MYSIYAMHKYALLVYKSIDKVAVYHICRSGSACPFGRRILVGG